VLWNECRGFYQIKKDKFDMVYKITKSSEVLQNFYKIPPLVD